MTITFEQAGHIARYLSIGLFEKKYREICIDIGEAATIGAVKKGLKNILYVKKNGKLDKKARTRAFTHDITNQELTELVAEIIENSVLLADTKLDMRKIPVIIAKEPVQEALPEEDLEECQEEEEYVPHEQKNDSADDSDYLDDLDEEEEYIPIESEDNPSVKCTKEIIDGEEYTTVGEELESNEEPQTSDADEEEDLFDPDSITYDEDDNIYLEQEENADESVKTSSESGGNMQIMVQQKTHTTISKQSYLLQVMGDDDKMNEKMQSMINRLVALDKGKVTELYIRGLMALIPLYSNNIERLAKDLDIDERDIILAVYENQFC